MKKEGWLLVIFLILFIGTMIGMNLPFYITGFTTGNASIGIINNVPSCLTVPNHSWTINTQKTLNLSEYCTDPENYDLVYNYTSVSEITISISNGFVTFTPTSSFSGTRIITFSVFDYVNTIYTNNITLSVLEVVSETPSGTSTSGTASVVTSTEGEPVILYLVPTIKFENALKYYLNEYFVEDTAIIEDIEVNSIIYFGSQDDENLAYAQIGLIEDRKLLFNFVDKNEELLQLEFVQGNYFELDDDGDGLGDYIVYADYVGDSVVDLRFVKIKKFSFELISFVSEYWFLIIILMIILSLLIIILKKKV